MPTLYTQTLGTGQPINLLHGWAMHSGIWRGFAEQLAQHYQVTYLDLPAHGHSDKITPFSLATVSDAIVNALPNTPSCWLGWSLGATIAIDIAQRYPELVSSLILLAGNPLFVATETWAGIRPEVLDSFAANLRVNCQTTLTRFLSLQINGMPDSKPLLKQLKTAINECPAPDTDSLQGGLDILKHSDLRSALAGLTIPITIILGEKDTLVPVAVAPHIQQLSSHLEVSIIKGAGHTPFLSHRSELLSLIQHFIDHHAR
jgi:pimeloyl-[acyl-carrier protein] methyl ester esterase